LRMARPERFELPTAWFVARYSIQLSYGRVVNGELCPTRNHGVKVDGNTERSAESDSMLGENGGERGIRTLDGAVNPILP
jgi:hypothetical protein